MFGISSCWGLLGFWISFFLEFDFYGFLIVGSFGILDVGLWAFSFCLVFWCSP